MGKRSRTLRERRHIAAVRPEPVSDEAPLYEIAPVRAFCIANDVGRVSWIEALTHPAGDCDGKLWKVLYVDAHVCERHLLQLIQSGRKIPVTLVKESVA